MCVFWSLNHLQVNFSRSRRPSQTKLTAVTTLGEHWIESFPEPWSQRTERSWPVLEE